VYLLMKRYEDAASSFRKAIELDPYLMPSYYSLEEIYLQEEGDPETAIELCKKQLTYNDRDVWAYVHLGWAYLGIGRLEEAREAYEHALELGPSYVQVLNQLGTMYRLLGRYPDALRTFQKVLDVDEQQVSAYYDAGVVCLLMRDDRGARRYFERFRQSTERHAASAPQNAQFAFDLAVVWTRLHDPARGWSLGQTANRLDATRRFDMARLLALQGRNGQALSTLDLAVKEGFRDFIRIKTDPDLAGLTENARFQELIAFRRRQPAAAPPPF
jgi:tetratricopeptide (TPR) repeat protein